jgi:hypothetical protein
MSDVGVLRPGIAIPTQFRGITYRSRLEANVAQFLYDLGLKFEYEVRSFLVNGKHYAPDFYLPEMDRFVEARGYITETSEEVLQEFVRQQGDLFVFYSDKAEHLQYHDELDIYRTELVVAMCDFLHASLGTLGHPSLREPMETAYPCWLCKKHLIEQPHRHRIRNITYLEVVMRSGVPVLVTEVGRYRDMDAE